MGEGQEIVAKKVILREFENGGWIILQNCHLGLKFMEEIETLVNKEAKIHEDFRLWITCEQRSGFPLGLLQKTIKVTNEPPKGIKAGLYKTFTTVINQEFLEKVECQQYWHALIYTICYLHSIVIERRKFGPLGWCIPYEFNNSDLEASLLFVEKYLNTIFSGPQQIQST
jgi:dynein heavy chain